MQLFLRLDVFGQLHIHFLFIFSRGNVSYSLVFFQAQNSIIFCKLDFLFTLLCYNRKQKIYGGVFSKDHLSTRDEKKLNWDLHAMQPWKHSRTSVSNPQIISFLETLTSLLLLLLQGFCSKDVWQHLGLCVEEDIFSTVGKQNKSGNSVEFK